MRKVLKLMMAIAFVACGEKTDQSSELNKAVGPSIYMQYKDLNLFKKNRFAPHCFAKKTSHQLRARLS